jgi:BirA family biotin operon repressor/biotin-[acetyl-CoA-carboxylase] ligase
MSSLSVEDIQKNLPTHTVGQTIIYYEWVDSTNTELKQMASVGAPEGTLLVADEQLAGRGRFERRWHAPPESSILASLLFRPAFLPPRQGQHLTMICALAAVEAIEAQVGVLVGVKWPNDLVYEGRKLAGLLTEVSLVEDKLDWVVVGMGLNVNFDFSSYVEADSALAQTATSLQMILGRAIPRIPLLQTYLVEVEKRYQALKAGQSPGREWAEKLTMLGQKVTVSGPQSSLYGLAEGVDEDGALLLRLPDGRLERILAGDVR